MAEVQWYKLALCLPLMATKASKSICQFRKIGYKISGTEVFAMLATTKEHSQSVTDGSILAVAALAVPTALNL